MAPIIFHIVCIIAISTMYRNLYHVFFFQKYSLFLINMQNNRNLVHRKTDSETALDSILYAEGDNSSICWILCLCNIASG